MISSIIIDDEEQNIHFLEGLLKEVAADVKVTGKAGTAKEGIKLIDTLNPDIVFLDIQLMGATGFEVLNSTKNRNYSVIFTTAYEKYAIKAIKFAALDYLLKPVDKIELIEAINKVKQLKSKEESSKNISVFLENIDNSKKQKLAISSQNSIMVIALNDIIFCEADGPYTIFHLKNRDKAVTSSKNLKEYEDLLNDQGFFRIHKSYLVNIKEVKEYLRADGGKILLSNNAILDVSDKRKDELLRLLSNDTHFLK